MSPVSNDMVYNKVYLLQIVLPIFLSDYNLTIYVVF